MIKWQKLESESQALGVYRTKVPGGWLVWAHWEKNPGTMTFLPDPDHKWDGKSLP